MIATKPTILLIGDRSVNLAALRGLLAGVEAEVVEAASVGQALSAARDRDFTLVLLDAQPPALDGLAVIAGLRRESRAHETPILVIANAQQDDLQRLYGRSGSIHIVANLLDDTVLMSKLRLVLELQTGRQALTTLRQQLAERSAQLEAEVIQRRKAEEMILHQLHHDVLTGLPNRLLYMDRLETAMQRSTIEGGKFALAYLDLDDFKVVNDRYGHQAGDELLRQIAARLRAVCRQSDIVARLGGDEFGVVLEEVDSADSVLPVLNRLREEIARVYHLSFAGHEGTIEVTMGASIGASIFPTHARTVDDLIRAADLAMYEVKATGKNRCQMCPDTAEGATGNSTT